MTTSLDFSTLELSPETEGLFPMRAVGDSREEQARFGTWWIAPFARSELDLVGLHMIPGRRLLDCPVVWASGPATITLASRAVSLVPVVIFSQMVKAPRRWREARELLQVEWDELLAAHAICGGESLDSLRAMVEDEELRHACQGSGPERTLAIAQAFERLDPSASRREVRFALQRILGGAAATSAGHRDSEWSAAVAALEASELACAHGAPTAQAQARWRLFAHPAGLDVARRDPLDPWPTPDAVAGAQRYHAAARALLAGRADVPPQVIADPLWTAVEALAAAPSPFDFYGVPFIEAAAALDEQGLPERAFAALTGVGYWAFFSEAEPMDGAIEAARDLAARCGWSHLEAITKALLEPPLDDA